MKYFETISRALHPGRKSESYRKFFGCLMMIMLLLMPGKAWADYGVYSTNMEKLSFDHPALVFRFVVSSSEDKGKCEYLNINFKVDGNWCTTNIEFTHLQRTAPPAMYWRWFEIEEGKEHYMQANGSNKKFYYKVFEAYKETGVTYFAIVFQDVDALKEYIEGGKVVKCNVSTYKNKAESSDSSKAKESFDYEFKVETSQSGIEGLKWSLEPTLDISAPESEIGRKYAMLQAADTITYLRTPFGELELKGGLSGQFTIPDGTQQLQVKGPLEMIENPEILGAPVSVSIKAECWNGASNTFDIKPFLDIQGMDVKKNFKLDENGRIAGNYEVTWKVAENPENDIQTTDQFMVLRAHREDFSDAVAVGTISLTDYDQSLTNTKNDGGYWYKVEDTGEDAFYTSERYGDKVYYRVVRAVVHGKWPAHRGKWCATKELSTSTYLPAVSTISVTKKSDFEESKAITLRVDLSSRSKTVSGKTVNFVWSSAAKITIERYSPTSEWYEGQDYAAKSIVISGDEVKYDAEHDFYYAEIEDIQSAPYTHYYYKAKVDGSQADYALLSNSELKTTNAVAIACYSESIAQLQSFIAQKGEGRGATKVEWSAGNGENHGYKLERRLYKATYSNGGEWQEVALDNVKALSYRDEMAYPGLVYEYRVIGYLDVRGKRYWTIPKTDYGYTKYYGRAQGSILMNDGSAWPLKTEATLRVGGNGIHIGRVENRTTHEVIIEGMDVPEGTIYRTELRPDGTFEFDSIPYIATDELSSIYYLATTADNVKNPTGSQGEFQISFTRDRYEYTDIRFTSDETRTCEGRIVYAGSTIPSRGIKFMVYDGDEARTLVDRNGDPVVTDNDGKYSFALPYRAQGIKVVAYKEGHKLKYDGVIQGGTGTKNVVCNIQDSTTVRLVGRLVGGIDQGKKPLGYGLSKNNLADKLTLVLQLEGDNTSYITYNDENPDNTTRQATFKQQVTTDETSYECDETAVSFERKRIVITPNKETGEFCLDLAPTKYKITQMYGTGYATFFAEGEGSAVLDLTQDSTLQTFTEVVDKVTYTTRYHHAYNRVYREPVKVTYKQYVDGAETEYYGSKKLKVKSIFGKEIAPEAYADGKYLFGHAVYVEGMTYEMKVTAHEDYYYNNERSTLPDIVPLRGGKLTVNNGLMASKDHNRLETKLDSVGSARFWMMADNTSFNLTSEAALRELNMNVELDGYYYEAEPLKAFVTGERRSDNGTLGTDIVPMVTLESPTIELLDIIRDPYTSGGYGYRERGTKYELSRTQTIDAGVDLDLKVGFGTKSTVNYGAWVGFGGGAYAGSSAGGGSTFTVSTTIPGLHLGGFWKGDCTVTLNERLETSRQPKDVGAMADVYVGVIPTYGLYHTEAFNVVDQETLDLLKSSVESGRVKVVQESVNEVGEKYYLIIADQTTLKQGQTRTFAYSQRHILNNVIPELVRQLDEVVVEGTKAEVQALADKNNTAYYRIIKDKFSLWTDHDWYEVILPTGNDKINIDKPKQIISSIISWMNLIRDNEARKVNAAKEGTLLKRYSISDVSVNYTQSASYSYKDDFKGNLLGFELKEGGMWNGIKIGASSSATIKKGQSSTEKEENQKVKTDEEGSVETNIKFDAPGFAFTFGLTPKITFDYSGSRNRKVTNLAGSGFYMGLTDNSYMDVDVYTEPVDNDVVLNDDDNYVWDKEMWQWISAKGDEDYKNAQNHDYVFVVRGGATRSPWYEPDSTIVVYPSAALGTKTLKIDNPKLYISNPVVNNLPKNEKAVFSLRLTNETEFKGDVSMMRGVSFTLLEDHSTNPDGAQLFIDGVAIGTGMSFFMKPGQSIVKTLEVQRGAKAYDYENIVLQFADPNNTLVDSKSISVHYLPESTPVRISTPTDKWVMNTLSAKDDDGKYYVPVRIDGFDVNYDNFDHIEFQYKKQTEGDDAWTNLCSYYAKDDEYYQQATGTKKLLESGSISDIRFYGEKDPMEMRYDLRAVSFCRLGTGYVTYASPVVSGTKDTRPPMLFGNPEPSTGILTHGDILSMTFSEDIAYNYLDETANFQINGFTNTSASESKVFLMVDADVSARTLVDENINAHDFTVDMMALVGNHETRNDLFKIVNSSSEQDGLLFCEDNNRLELHVGNTLVAESGIMPIDMEEALTHVGFTYNYENRIVQFFVGDNIIETKMNVATEISLQGHIELSTQSEVVGINNLRVWAKELSGNEIANLSSGQLTGSEINLIGYWPLTDGFGRVAKDLANGNNMQITNAEWHTMDGMSLFLRHQPLKLEGQEAYKFSRQATEDYTLGFWYGNWELSEAADSISLFHAGDPEIVESGKFNIFLKKENGMRLLKLESEGRIFNFGTTDFTPMEWHHIAVSVNHSLNSVSMFIDGEIVGQTSGTQVGGLTTSAITLGDKNLAGVFDEIEFWQLALPANYIKNNFIRQRKGDEMGMTVFMPFETMRRDGTIYNMEFSAKNHAVYTEPGKDAINVDAREPLFDKDQLATEQTIAEHETCAAMVRYEAPVNSNSGIESLPFSWTGTDTKLQINIKKDDYDINGRYINVTVRGVEDLAGNPMVSPVMWTVYVQRNVLFFGHKNLSLTTEYGKKKTVATTIRNESGKTLSFTIDPNCTWLTPSLAYGQLDPLEEKDVEFEISDGLSPGSYATKAYLTDENGLTTSVTIKAMVTIDEPEWNVTTDQRYNLTMNLMATVYQQDNVGQWIIDTDPKDIIGAFIGNTCVGKTKLTVDKVTGASYLYMTIRGKEDELGSDVIFRLWDASTGNIHYISQGKRVDGKWQNERTFFTYDAVIGADQPVEMRTTLSRIQSIDLSEGWNWISFNVSIDEGNGLFMNTEPFTPGDMFKTQGISSIYKGNEEWTQVSGEFVLSRNNVYEVYVQNACKISIDGKAFSDDELEITLNFNNNPWAPLAYLQDVTLPINVALNDFAIGEKAPVGTMIKTYNEFAVAREDGKWIGSLQFMRPGVGYFVNCNGDQTTKTIHYYPQLGNSNNGTRAAAPATMEAMPSATRSSSDMMPVIATFKDGDVKESDILVAYANGKIVGVAQPGAEVADEDKAYDDLFFLSVNAADGDAIKFVKYRDGEAVAATRKGITFSAKGIAGTLEKPYLIDFTQTSENDIYDITGRKYATFPVENGMYIIDDKKVYIRK